MVVAFGISGSTGCSIPFQTKQAPGRRSLMRLGEFAGELVIGKQDPHAPRNPLRPVGALPEVAVDEAKECLDCLRGLADAEINEREQDKR